AQAADQLRGPTFGLSFLRILSRDADTAASSAWVTREFTPETRIITGKPFSRTGTILGEIRSPAGGEMSLSGTRPIAKAKTNVHIGSHPVFVKSIVSPPAATQLRDMPNDVPHRDEPDRPAVLFHDGKVPVAADIHLLQGQCQEVVRADGFRFGGHVVFERLVGVVADAADHLAPGRA